MRYNEKQTSKRGKLLQRKIVTSLDWNEKDALLIRLVEAVEEMANHSAKTLEIFEKISKKK